MTGPDIASLYSQQAREAPPSGHPVPTVPVVINFDQGLPDPRFFPIERLRRCMEATLDEDGSDALRYFGQGGTTEMQRGYVGLRTALADWISRRDDRPLDAGDVVLVNGSTDGLALAVRAFLGPGDAAVVEAATYPPTRQFMRATGAAVRTVPLDGDGMVVDALADCLDGIRADGLRPKLIYTVPTFQAPTGTVMPLARRERLVALAQEQHVMVLEDNCYYEFGYDGRPPPTLFALDDSGLVLQSDSFSKYVAPGLRMAWVAGAPDALEAVVRVRQDFAVSQLVARALERYVRGGDLDAHIVELRDVYRRKRDLTAEALRVHCEPLVCFATPSGGFYFWLQIADEVDWDQARAELADQGIAFRPGDGFIADGDTRRFVRISSIQVPEDDIEPGLAALGAALRRAATR